jgi:hypothetical protein
MGKLVVTEFVSIDGVFEDPGGSRSTAGGRSNMTGVRTATASSSTS